MDMRLGEFESAADQMDLLTGDGADRVACRPITREEIRNRCQRLKAEIAGVLKRHRLDAAVSCSFPDSCSNLTPSVDVWICVQKRDIPEYVDMEIRLLVARLTGMVSGSRTGTSPLWAIRMPLSPHDTAFMAPVEWSEDWDRVLNGTALSRDGDDWEERVKAARDKADGEWSEREGKIEACRESLARRGLSVMSLHEVKSAAARLETAVRKYLRMTAKGRNAYARVGASCCVDPSASWELAREVRGSLVVCLDSCLQTDEETALRALVKRMTGIESKSPMGGRRIEWVFHTMQDDMSAVASDDADHVPVRREWLGDWDAILDDAIAERRGGVAERRGGILGSLLGWKRAA